MENDKLEYAGFWVRTLAAFLDGLLLAFFTVPILLAIYGQGYFESEQFSRGLADFLISWVFPAVWVLTFWIYKQATPGKMLVSTKVVDARTGQEPSTGQLVGRYFAYFLSFLPLGLGCIWVAFDSRKQGWHDKLAGTVVVRHARRGPKPVHFE